MSTWKFSVGAVILVSVALAAGHPFATAASADARAKIDELTSLNVSKIVVSCDRVDPNESLGMSKPTVISRFRGDDAVIFANGSRYSACVVFGKGNTEASHPVAYSNIPKGVKELEALVTSDKVPHKTLWTTNGWFVVKVGPAVTSVKAVTGGSSQVSKITDGFALVHNKETADIKGAFVFGIAVGFTSDGTFNGSAGLR
jgi:hypothetical protein